MEDRLALQCPTLEGMTEGVTQVQCLANALLMRVLLHDALLHLHAVSHHSLQLLQVGVGKVEAHQFFPHRLGRNQTMLQHLGITRTDVLGIQSLQELSVENHELRVVENAHFVLQTAEVDTGLSAHRSIHHGKQGGRDIDEVDATLKGAGSKTSQVGHHAASQVNHARVTGSATLLQSFPNHHEALDVLVAVGCRNRNHLCFLHAVEFLQQREALFLGSGISKNKQLVVLTFGKGAHQFAF